jgi:hypothetical protein
MVQGRRLTTKEFVERAVAVHGDRYDYTQVGYVDFHSRVWIVCRMHGGFYQSPQSHVFHRAGCPKCSQRYSPSTAEWVRQMQAIHGDRYDYTESLYRGANRLVTIGCRTHGPFDQLATRHAHGVRCPLCAAADAPTTAKWIRSARAVHGNRYDYSLVDYVRSKQPIVIVCRVHGPFEQRPNDHVSGRNGCAACAGRYSPTTAEWVERARGVHGDRYDYSEVVDRNSHSKVTVVCGLHGGFDVAPGNHIANRSGCPTCARLRAIGRPKPRRRSANETGRGPRGSVEVGDDGGRAFDAGFEG